MADIDSLSIQIEASSDEATKRINALTNALKKLQSATTGKFGNVDEQISDIGQTSSAATRTAKRKQAFYDATKQPKSKTSAKDVFPGTEEISKAIDSARQKYDEFIQYVEKNSGKITRDAASDVSRKISAEQENLQKILDGIESGIGQTPKESADLYAAADALQSAQEKIRQIWGKPAPQIIDTKSIQAATDSAAKFQETLETPSLGTADEFLKANSQIDILQRKAESLKVSLDEALGKGDQAKADKLTEQYRRVTSQIEKLGQESEKTASKVNDLKNAYKSATNPISKFTKTLGRIAYYRMIRSAIKAVTDGIKTGMDNLYEYSRITGTEFKPAMDSLATSSLYLKNSLGALAQPIVSALAPAFETLVDWIVMAINYFNQFISALSGKDVYTAAKKHAVEYKEATDAAAKSTKKFLLGIDELNIMEAPSGGGAGGASTDYGDMFEEKPINSTIKDVAAKVQELMPLIEAVGIGLAGWMIASNLIPDLHTVLRLIGSLALAVGVKLIIDSVTDIVFGNGLTWDNILKGTGGGALAGGGLGLMLAKHLGISWYKGMLTGAVIGIGVSLMIMGIADVTAHGLSIGNTLTTAIGGALVGAAIGFTKIGGVAGAGIGAVIGIGVSLVITGITDIVTNGLTPENAGVTAIGGALAGAGIGFFLGGPAGAAIGTAIGVGVTVLVSAIVGKNVAYENSEFHKQMEAIREKAAEVMEINKQINVNIETRYKNLDSVKADFAAMRKILDDMFVLADKPDKTVAEIETLKSYVDIVNSWNLEGVKVEWDELNQLVIADKDAIYEVIDALEKQALATAAQEMMVDAYKDLISATKNAKESVSEYNKANDALIKLQDEKNRLMAKYSFLERQAGESDVAYANRMRGSAEAANKFHSEMTDLNRRIGDAESALKDAETAVKNSADAMSGAQGQINEFGKIMSGNAEIGADAFGDLELSANEMYRIIGQKNWGELGENIIKGIVAGIKDNYKELERTSSSAIKGVLKTMKDEARIKSPSKLFKEEVGKNIGAGVAVGIKDSSVSVNAAAEELVSSAKDVFDEADFDTVTINFEAETNGIKDQIEKVFDGISYNPDINYKKLMNEASALGNWEEYARLEKIRNAKIAGEGITDYKQSFDYAYMFDGMYIDIPTDTSYSNNLSDYVWGDYDSSYASGIDYDRLQRVFTQSSEEVVQRISQENQARTNMMTSTISEDMEEASNNVINAVMAIGQQIVQAVNNKQTNFTLDGKQLARSMQAYNEQANRNRGGSFVRVGG